MPCQVNEQMIEQVRSDIPAQERDQYRHLAGSTDPVDQPLEGNKGIIADKGLDDLQDQSQYNGEPECAAGMKDSLEDFSVHDGIICSSCFLSFYVAAKLAS